MKFVLDIAYKGTYYHGWQRQPNAMAVQEAVTDKLSVILGREVDIVASGRTDAGVHAAQQIAHFESERPLPKGFRKSMNALLSPDIAIKAVYEVQDDFHARFDATSRTYHYYVAKEKDPFRQEQFYHFRPYLDIAKMNEAAAYLFRHSNFESFSKVHTDVNHFNCEITRAYWEEQEEGRLVFTIQANRFLRGMVRAVVGTLMDVGCGRMAPEEVEKILLARDRKKAGRSVPACGLFLSHVAYPKEQWKLIE